MSRVPKINKVLILKFLYAVMLAPAQPKQLIHQQLKTVLYPRQSNYARLSAFVNIVNRVFPTISTVISQGIANNNHFPLYSSQPARLIGSGANAAVFKINDAVLRIYRKSFGEDPNSALITAKLYQKQYLTINSWYQNKYNLILPMQFLILHGPPLSQPTAASLQPYLLPSRKDLFKDFTQEQLLKIFHAQPAFKQAFLFFIEQTLHAYYQQNACPDLLGEDNLIIIYRDGVPHMHILDIGILQLDDVKAKSPHRIPQIEAAIHKLELLYKLAKNSANPNTRFLKTNSTTSTPTSTPDTPHSTIDNTFTVHLQSHAIKYYPELDPLTTHVQLTKTENRLTSRLFYFKISDHSQTKSVLVKYSLAKPKEKNSTQLNKPRLYPATHPLDMPSLEYRALSTIQSHFKNVDPAHINTIIVLDFLQDNNAIIMEVAQLPNLRSRYLKAARRLSIKPKYPIISTFKNVGKWLHYFHEIPIKNHVKNRNVHLENFIKDITTLTKYLTKTTHYKRYFASITTDITNLAKKHLPNNLPLGLGHGDFATRNILTNKQGTVTILDTFAKWNVPIYEDIGYFLNNIHTSWYQVATLGFVYSSQRIAVYEEAFLSGYFQNSPNPYPQIKLFEILALLDKWADTIQRANVESRRIIIKPIILALSTLFYKKRLKQILNDIHTHPSTKI